ncbi:MAG: 2Fe-2S iron-sulfur cluster binding domain-containing protein [Verrucomicrobia bacterium]|nr:2Fe-2S iron-sulfur cluster binding domain-containing protein [Verrucomicrobiota bacterium]
MQSLLENWRALEQGNWALPVAYLLVAAIALQVLLMLYGTARRQLAEREQMRLSTRRLGLEVETAMLRYREAEQTKFVWNGYRKFRVAQKTLECKGVFSFHLTPHDGKPLPPFKPGQFLTFQLKVPGQAKPVVRCYSLSDGPNHLDHYRVTIKKELPPPDKPNVPPGVASSFFCDSVEPGEILDVKAPGGNFYLDLTKDTGMVLISAGVGVTPMLSMLNAVVANKSQREVWFFFGVRNKSEHIQKEYLERVAAEHDNVHLHVSYSKPTPEDRLRVDYQHAGRVSVELFKQLLPSNNYEYFLCGPGAFMKSITDGLSEWGVPSQSVFFEAFGPATIKKAAPPVAASAAAQAVEVNFSRSGKVCQWKPESGSLLDLAEANGIKIECGCRTGNCGTCLVAIKSGKIDYMAGHGAASEDGSCLTCICKPQSDLVLDA